MVLQRRLELISKLRLIAATALVGLSAFAQGPRYKGSFFGDGAGLTNVTAYATNAIDNLNGFGTNTIIRAAGGDPTTNALVVYDATGGQKLLINNSGMYVNTNLISDGELWVRDSNQDPFTHTDASGFRVDSGQFVGNGAGISNVLATNLVSGTVLNPLRVTFKGQNWWLSNMVHNINIVNFGADPTGSADSTTAIQTCLDLSTNGLEVYVPRGTYKVLSTLNIPTEGTSVSNRFRMFGDGYGASILRGYNDVNLLQCLTDEGGPPVPSLAHLEIEGIGLLGPAFNTTNLVGGVPTAYPTNTAVPFQNCSSLFIGKPGVFEGAGNQLNGYNIRLRNVEISGSYYGLCVSNVVGLNIEQCRIYRNAYRACMLSHVDTMYIQGGNYGTCLVTNIYDSAYTFEFTGTGYPGSAADSGVHNLIAGIECDNLFAKADGKRFTVLGGHFEVNPPFSGLGSAYTNGWCVLTNYAPVTFINPSLTMPIGQTNFAVFVCRNRASIGLKIYNASFDNYYDFDSRIVTVGRLFRIESSSFDTNFYAPYYDIGVEQGFIGGYQKEPETYWLNCQFDGTNYFHVRPQKADVLQVSSLARNGRRFSILNARDGSDTIGGFTNQPYANGPYMAATTAAIPGSSFRGAAMTYGPAVAASARPWVFAPFTPEPTPSGAMPRNYRIYVPVVCTNVFTNLIMFRIASFTASSGIQAKSAQAFWGYYQTNTNTQVYVSNPLTFDNPPDGPVSIEWGFAGAAAITNNWQFFDAKIEYW